MKREADPRPAGNEGLPPGAERKGLTSAGSAAVSSGADAGPTARRQVWSALALLAALGVPLYFVGMGRLALMDPDEPYYAVPAMEMLHSGSWRVPLFHGQPWFDKPILFYWIVLAGFRLLGTTELAARVGSGLAALAGVLALALHARRRARARGASPGVLEMLLPALVLATMLEYVAVARSAITDMVLTLFLTLGMIAAWRFLDEARTRWMALAGVAFGLAALTKGPVGIVLPVLALGAWSVLARRADLLRPRALAAAALGAAVSAGPWYVYMGIAHRGLLFDTFIDQGNLDRLLRPEHQTSPLFYVAVLALGLLPWSGGLPFALVEGVREVRRSRRTEQDAPRGARDPLSPLFELCWFGAIVLVFSLAASRLATYILPAFPPAALLLADFWSRRLDAASPRAQGPRTTAWMLPALVGVPCALVIALGARSEAALEWIPSAPVLASLGILLGLASLAASLAARTRRPGLFLTVQSATSVLIVLFAAFVAAPGMEERRSVRPLIRELQRRGVDSQVAGAFHERDFSMDFYLGRTLPRVTGRKSLEAAVAAGPGAIWIVPRANVAQVMNNKRLRVRLVAESSTASALRLTPAGEGRAGAASEGPPPSRGPEPARDVAMLRDGRR